MFGPNTTLHSSGISHYGRADLRLILTIARDFTRQQTESITVKTILLHSAKERGEHLNVPASVSCVICRHSAGQKFSQCLAEPWIWKVDQAALFKLPYVARVLPKVGDHNEIP